MTIPSGGADLGQFEDWQIGLPAIIFVRMPERRGMSGVEEVDKWMGMMAAGKLLDGNLTYY
jgi:murein endopeptidase